MLPGLTSQSELSSDESNDIFKRIAAACLNNPTLEERASLVLSRLPRAILRSWISAAREDTEVQYDHRWLAAESRVTVGTVRSKLADAERRVIEAVDELDSGTFDYDHWYKFHIQSCEMSARALLARIGEPIPPGAGLDELKLLAATRLTQAKCLTRLAYSMFYDYYGLGPEPALDIKDMATKYNRDASKIKGELKNRATLLRQRLGKRKAG